jgi:hypothetical protein
MTDLQSMLRSAFETLTTKVEVPALAGTQAQGDLLLMEWPEQVAADYREVAIDRARILRVESLLTSHQLVGDGRARWDGTCSESGLTLGHLVVPAGALAVLGHDEHGDLHIAGPATGELVLVVRRQRRAVPARPGRQGRAIVAALWSAVID